MVLSELKATNTYFKRNTMKVIGGEKIKATIGPTCYIVQ